MLSKRLENAEEAKKDSFAAFGTGAFAVLNIIAATLIIILCMSVFVFYGIETVTRSDKVDIFMWSMCIVVNYFGLIVFGFGVLLFLGMYQKKSSYVLAYLIFGVIIDMTLVSGIVLTVCVPIDWAKIDKSLGGVLDDYLEPVSKAIVGSCVVYTLILAMICRTWVLMRSRNSEDRKKLINSSI